MVLPTLLLIVAGLALSLPLTAALIRIGHGSGALDSQGTAGHQKELRPIPNIGGVAIYLAVALPLVVGLLVVNFIDLQTIQGIIPAFTDDLHARMKESSSTAWALVGCITALHVMGLIDDRRPLGAFPKLAIQAATALIMVIWFDVRLLTVLGPAGSIAVTVAWIVVMTNAINFLDNMDGLAGGVSAIAAILFLVAALVNAQWFIAATLALLIGALIGFLIFNFPPAKIFMGDGGSLVVGFLLAVLTARTTFYNPEMATSVLGDGWYAVFMPVIILAIPLYDFTSVTLIRLMQGKSPFVGDQQHFSHRLVQRGLSKRGAVIVIWGATAITGISGIALGRLEGWQAILVGAQTLMVLGFIAIFEHASRHAVGRGASS